ncbi:MAG: hypothetical protein QM762_06600 [Chryseolinea sp.]
MPPTRADYEKALQAAGPDGWKVGYLPYAIVDRCQQLSKDFAYWRVLTYGRGQPALPAPAAPGSLQDRRRPRGADPARPWATLSHFVGDGAQPLHVTVHYNGWGDYPNPKGYTTGEDTDGSFEGAILSCDW